MINSNYLKDMIAKGIVVCSIIDIPKRRLINFSGMKGCERQAKLIPYQFTLNVKGFTLNE